MRAASSGSAGHTGLADQIDPVLQFSAAQMGRQRAGTGPSIGNVEQVPCRVDEDLAGAGDPTVPSGEAEQITSLDEHRADGDPTTPLGRKSVVRRRRASSAQRRHADRRTDRATDRVEQADHRCRMPSVVGHGDLDPRRFTAMTRLDHNRAVTQLAQRTGTTVNDVTNMTIWGNHSVTQFADLYHAKVNGKNAYDLVGDQAWYEGEYIPTVQQRGAAIIKARGLSSAASAANAAIDHMHDWALGTPAGDWVSMAVCSDGSYGADEGLISSFPCTTANGQWSVVQGLELNEFARARFDATVAELREERDAVRELGLIG